MQSIVTKNTGDSLTSVEWNGVPDELENAITDTGQALSGADLFQVSKAMSIYAAGGSFYTDSGVADAYVLTTVGSKRAPTAYFDGMSASFKPGNTSTGASTVNVSGLGVKSITDKSGVALIAGAIISGDKVDITYDLAGDRFELSDILLVDEQVTLAKLSDSATEADNVRKRVIDVLINFNGTGVIAERKSFGVSSIADSGLGLYRINFTVNMPDANYIMVEGPGPGTGDQNDCSIKIITQNVAYIDISSTQGSILTDNSIICLAIFAA